jgi:hypothetical protein
MMKTGDLYQTIDSMNFYVYDKTLKRSLGNKVKVPKNSVLTFVNQLHVHNTNDKGIGLIFEMYLYDSKTICRPIHSNHLFDGLSKINPDLERAFLEVEEDNV